MRLSLTQTTRHGRLAILPEIKRLNSAGTPTGLATSSAASGLGNVPDHTINCAAVNSMVPALNTRCRSAARLFSRFRSSPVFGCSPMFDDCCSANFSACRAAIEMFFFGKPGSILVHAILNEAGSP